MDVNMLEKISGWLGGGREIRGFWEGSEAGFGELLRADIINKICLG
jgi:hypothetical protein